MQQHPIPQNITGFEFKLIGDMTIKQFAYLAGAAILTYLTILSPAHPFIKFPLSVFFVLLGIGLAFIPVEGRPLDRWIRNFIRALFEPNQFIFHKQGGDPSIFQTFSPPPKVIKTNADNSSYQQIAAAEKTQTERLHNDNFASLLQAMPQS